MEELYEYVIKFMYDNEITCDEDIHQSDRIQEKLTGFMCDCFNFVKDELPVDEED